ncbi:MAG: hypothetical protein J1E06_11815 [Acutalibacter sp.]|nr:hypothetical protein [Acutalibacter sp.]
MSLKKELFGILCLIAALVIFSVAAGRVLTPKRLDYGATWDMYLKEPEDSIDVLFFGTSLAYFDVVPAVIYDETGITSYVMAGPEQTYAVTYSYLTESCKTQSPQAVFVEATGLLTGKSNRSVKVNLTYMPWGKNRIATTFEEASEDELPGLLFPLYAYHDRWDDLTDQDWQIGLSGYEADPLAGYTFMAKHTAIEEFEQREFEDAEENYARNLEVAKKMADFCRQENIRLVFFLSPVTNRIEDGTVQQMKRDLTALGADFADFNETFEEVAFDLSMDFYDPLHTNSYGAEKFSRYLADRLPEYGIASGGQGDAELWRGRVDTFVQKLAEGREVE